MVRVVCAGHVNWDVTLEVDRFPSPDRESRVRERREGGGGSAANVAASLAALSVRAGVVGAVGDDERGRRAGRELAAAGVDTAYLRTVPDRPTTVKYLLVDADGEVAVLGTEGANEAIDPEGVDPEYVRSADHLHLTGQHPATAAALAEVAAGAGVPVSFDPGRRFADRGYGRVLELVDLVFVNDCEADALASVDPSSDDRTVVVTHGDCGAELRGPTGAHAHAGFDVETVDTAGAGDAFAAGFIAARLAGDDAGRALAYANACGALAAGAAGARSAPDRAAVAALLD